MVQKAILHAACVVGTALTVVMIGTRMVGPEGQVGVYFGVTAAFVFQAAAFWLLALWLFADRLWIAYVLQMLGRFTVVGAVAFGLIPAFGLPTGPTLLSLVAVFFATTLFEPVFLSTRSST
jgi:hypothetical protein